MTAEVSALLEEGILFFQNGKGGFAVSVNSGDTAILSNGKEISLGGKTIWVEAEDEMLAEASLSPVQKEAVERIRTTTNLSQLDIMALTLKRGRLLNRKHFAQPERVYPVLPEIAIATKSDLDD